jgi:hypothetical protein
MSEEKKELKVETKKKVNKAPHAVGNLYTYNNMWDFSILHPSVCGDVKTILCVNELPNRSNIPEFPGIDEFTTMEGLFKQVRAALEDACDITDRKLLSKDEDKIGSPWTFQVGDIFIKYYTNMTPQAFQDVPTEGLPQGIYLRGFMPPACVYKWVTWGALASGSKKDENVPKGLKLKRITYEVLDLFEDDDAEGDEKDHEYYAKRTPENLEAEADLKSVQDEFVKGLKLEDFKK